MSFQRRVETTPTHFPGTRPSRSISTVSTLSTGIPSLDDVLGGGLPLGSVVVLLAPDPNTAYAELVQRHFVAQGIASGQSVCILDDSAVELASNCMWMSSTSTAESQDVDELSTERELGVKIAWRYENMKKFQTSVIHTGTEEDAYSHPLDLTYRIPEHVVNEAIASERLRCLPVSSSVHVNATDSTVARLEDVFCEMEQTPSAVIRLSIPSLGSPQWGDMTTSDVLRLLHFLRARLRQTFIAPPRISALITLPSYLSQDDWGGPGWSQKLGWLSDGCITFRSFSFDPALLSMFPSHHGLVDIHTLPSPHTLISPSDKFSELRGLSALSSSTIGGGENNLAFRCTRKRFIIETLHLDVEGGVNERRTTTLVKPDHDLPAGTQKTSHVSAPTVQISVDDDTGEIKTAPGKKSSKKNVTFQTDRPDLYEF